MPTTNRFARLWERIPTRWRTTLARMFWTAVQTFVGLLLAVPLLEVDITALQAAGAAGLSSALVVLKDAARGELKRLEEPPAPPDTSGWVDPPGDDTGLPSVGGTVHTDGPYVVGEDIPPLVVPDRNVDGEESHP